MLRKTMIVLAKAAALTSGLTVEAFAHGDAEGMRGPRCGWLRVKLLAPTSRAAALFYGRLFEIAPAVKPLLRGDMTEQGCKLMATLALWSTVWAISKPCCRRRALLPSDTSTMV